MRPPSSFQQTRHPASLTTNQQGFPIFLFLPDSIHSNKLLYEKKKKLREKRKSDFTDECSFSLSDSVSAYYTTARANALIYFLLSLLVSLMHDEFHTPLSPNQCSPLAGEVRGKGGDGLSAYTRWMHFIFPFPSPLTPHSTHQVRPGRNPLTASCLVSTCLD